MKQERTLSIEGKEYTLLISDEPQALLEAKASGRAVLGCLDTGNGEGASRDFQGIPYVVPSMEYVPSAPALPRSASARSSHRSHRGNT